MSASTVPQPSFRVSSKTLFLTFPQCEYPLADFVSRVKDFFKKKNRVIQKGVASQELHSDGNKHLHLFVILDKQISTCNVTYFDSLVDPAKHPNIVSRLRGTHVATIKYVIKDGNYISFPDSFDLTGYLQVPVQEDGKKEPMAKVIARGITEGQTLADLDDLYPHYVMTHLGPLERYIEFRQRRVLQATRARAPVGTFHVKPAPGHEISSNIQLASWLNLMIFNRSIPHRPTQMWVKSPPGSGKSSLIKLLEDSFGVSVYRWPTEEQWFDGYSDGVYDLIVLD